MTIQDTIFRYKQFSSNLEKGDLKSQAETIVSDLIEYLVSKKPSLGYKIDAQASQLSSALDNKLKEISNKIAVIHESISDSKHINKNAISNKIKERQHKLLMDELEKFPEELKSAFKSESVIRQEANSPTDGFFLNMLVQLHRGVRLMKISIKRPNILQIIQTLPLWVMSVRFF